MSANHQRMSREKHTIEVMIGMYCRAQHENNDMLCIDCQELLEYANNRLDRCPFQENKTTCAKCPTHCYKPVMRERIREVMRFSGPRMMHRHPSLAIHHFVDGRRKEPIRGPQNTSD